MLEKSFSEKKSGSKDEYPAFGNFVFMLWQGHTGQNAGGVPFIRRKNGL